MSNQYTYYTPNDDDQNQKESYYKEPHRKTKKGASRWVKTDWYLELLQVQRFRQVILSRGNSLGHLRRSQRV